MRFDDVVRRAAVGAACLLAASCAGHLASLPGVFVASEATVTVAQSPVRLTLAKPTSPRPPAFLVVFASGDGGLRGTSMALFRHLAERGVPVAGFSSPEAFERVLAQSRERPNYFAARDAFVSIVAAARRGLDLPETTPLILTGMSRGANVVIAAGGDPTLNPGIAGAVAIALTREFDDLSIPAEARQRAAGIETDDKGRIQTYPAIKRLGSTPLAIIQSTNDSYVTSAESRRLLGPDTPTRRLYEVQSSDHSFGGGRDALMRDLDEALTWIAGLHRGTAAE